MRNHSAPFLQRLAAAAATVTALASCSSGSGTINPLQLRPTAGTTPGGDSTENGHNTVPGFLPQQSVPKSVASTGNSSPSWAISMPDSLDGHPRVTPSSSQQQNIDGLWKTEMDLLGVSGTSTTAVYDDAQDDYFLIVTGVTGSGFNPANLQNVTSAPAASPPGPDDRVTQLHPRVDPGPHGGDDICTYISTVIHTDSAFGPLTSVTEDTACDWMTATTAGSFTFYPKGDLKPSGINGQVTPAVAAQVLVKVRDAVEHRRG